jgi:hypothetical protein
MGQPAPANSIDPKQFWKDTFTLFYEAYLQEMASQRLSKRWHSIDTVTSVFVTTTASGSAIAGWALWSSPEGKIVWVTIAAVSSILSLIHSTLQVPSKMKAQDELRGCFSGLRLDIEQFRRSIRNQLSAGQIPSGAEDSYTEFLHRYTEYMKRVPDSITVTNKLLRDIQSQLNLTLQAEIA